MRCGVIGAAGVLALLVMAPGALAGGQPEMSVQHDLTNGVFATAEWQRQTATHLSDVAVSVVRQRHGLSVLDLSAVYDTLDANGEVSDETFIVADTTTGFQVSTDPTGLGSAALAGRVPVTICTHFSVTCRPATASLTVTWTGVGLVTRGATAWRPDVEPEAASLYLLNEQTSGSSRQAVAAGMLNGHSLSAGSVASASIGTVRDGTIFVCLNGGCEN